MNQKRLKISLIEDEPDICSTLASFLSKRGHAISSSESGLQGLATIKTFQPDLVILDITLNDISGLEVLRRLRACDEKTKVLVITGTIVSQKEKEELFALGIRGYYLKPVHLEKIESLIFRIIGGSEQIFFDPETLFLPSAEKASLKNSPSASHKLLNCVSIIRHQCEHFLLDLNDGLYKGKTEKEMIQIALKIFKDVIQSADKAAQMIHQDPDRLQRD